MGSLLKTNLKFVSSKVLQLHRSGGHLVRFDLNFCENISFSVTLGFQILACQSLVSYSEGKDIKKK